MNKNDQDLLQNAIQRGWLDAGAAQRVMRTVQVYQSQGQVVSLSRILVQQKLLTNQQIQLLAAGSGQQGAVPPRPPSRPLHPQLQPPPPVQPQTTPERKKEVLLDHWRVTAKLGEGAMGQVYKAVSNKDGRIAAIKVLPKFRAKDNSVRERFLREAETTVKCQHQHIVSGFDQGECDGNFYYSMELLDGGSAQQFLDKNGPYTETQTLQIGLQVLRALDYANKLSLIHRDIKPDNIMLTKDGKVKLTDLGLARQTDSGEARLTMVGTTVGTPYYLSPEQARGMRDLDIRTDIYSLGISMFHLATGRVPFDNPQVPAVLKCHISEPLPDPRTIRADLSAGFTKLLNTMCQKEAGKRYPLPGQVIQDIERMLKGKPLQGPDFGAATRPAAVIADSGKRAVKEKPSKPSKPRPAGVPAQQHVPGGDVEPSGNRIGLILLLMLALLLLAGLYVAADYYVLRFLPWESFLP